MDLSAVRERQIELLKQTNNELMSNKLKVKTNSLMVHELRENALAIMPMTERLAAMEHVNATA